MKTIGSTLREARVSKRLSIKNLETETKIKASFIAAIENENWSALPEYSVVVGFVKRIGDYLGIGTAQSVALLRRDYPPKMQVVASPKPDVERHFIWSPRLTILVVVAAIVGLVGFYLYSQYRAFSSPPTLVVSAPVEGQVVDQLEFNVAGTTDPSASVIINNQPTLVEANGTFSIAVSLLPGDNSIEVRAKSRGGKETVVIRKIVVKR